MDRLNKTLGRRHNKPNAYGAWSNQVGRGGGGGQGGMEGQSGQVCWEGQSGQVCMEGQAGQACTQCCATLPRKDFSQSFICLCMTPARASLPFPPSRICGARLFSVSIASSATAIAKALFSSSNARFLWGYAMESVCNINTREGSIQWMLLISSGKLLVHFFKCCLLFIQRTRYHKKMEVLTL